MNGGREREREKEHDKQKPRLENEEDINSEFSGNSDMDIGQEIHDQRLEKSNIEIDDPFESVQDNQEQINNLYSCE